MHAEQALFTMQGARFGLPRSETVEIWEMMHKHQEARISTRFYGEGFLWSGNRELSAILTTIILYRF